MGTIKCPCSACGNNIAFEAEQMGTTVTCPHCHQATTLFAPEPAAPPVSNLYPCPECGQQISRRAAACPHCGVAFAAPPPVQQVQQPRIAYKKGKSEFAGMGCLLQGIGLIALFFFPVGTVIGAVLLIYGSIASRKIVCSLCGINVSKSAEICPACHSQFKGYESGAAVRAVLATGLVLVIVACIAYTRASFIDAARYGKTPPAQAPAAPAPSHSNPTTSTPTPQAAPLASQTPEAQYGRASVVIYDVQARYYETYSDEKIPGIAYKVKNKGNRSLNAVEVTFYFKDRNNRTIAELSLHPVAVSKYSSDPPLKPGYIWQTEAGRFYKAKNVPSEWLEGAVEYKVTDVEFAEDSQ